MAPKTHTWDCTVYYSWYRQLKRLRPSIACPKSYAESDASSIITYEHTRRTVSNTVELYTGRLISDRVNRGEVGRLTAPDSVVMPSDASSER